MSKKSKEEHEYITKGNQSYSPLYELSVLLNSEINLLRNRLVEKDILIKEMQEQIDVLEKLVYSNSH